MLKILLIALGGAFGSVARFLIGGWIQKALARPFPLGTILINITGCLAIGFLYTRLPQTPLREEYRMGIIVGVLGGYTTFSSFAWETMNLTPLWALFNVTISVVVGLAACWLGIALARAIYGA